MGIVNLPIVVLNVYKFCDTRLSKRWHLIRLSDLLLANRIHRSNNV